MQTRQTLNRIVERKSREQIAVVMNRHTRAWKLRTYTRNGEQAQRRASSTVETRDETKKPRTEIFTRRINNAMTPKSNDKGTSSGARLTDACNDNLSNRLLLKITQSGIQACWPWLGRNYAPIAHERRRDVKQRFSDFARSRDFCTSSREPVRLALKRNSVELGESWSRQVSRNDRPSVRCESIDREMFVTLGRNGEREGHREIGEKSSTNNGLVDWAAISSDLNDVNNSWGRGYDWRDRGFRSNLFCRWRVWLIRMRNIKVVISRGQNMIRFSIAGIFVHQNVSILH